MQIHDFAVIIGPSGAGKSTLLYSLSGIDGISGGKIFYKGEKISGYSEMQTARVAALLEQMRMGEVGNRLPAQASGGENTAFQQKISSRYWQGLPESASGRASDFDRKTAVYRSLCRCGSAGIFRRSDWAYKPLGVLDEAEAETLVRTFTGITDSYLLAMPGVSTTPNPIELSCFIMTRRFPGSTRWQAVLKRQRNLSPL